MARTQHTINLKQARHYLKLGVSIFTLVYCYSAQAMDKTVLSGKLSAQAQNTILQAINNHPKTLKALRTQQNGKLSSRLSQLMLEQKTEPFKLDPMLRLKNNDLVQVYINVSDIDDRTREKLQNEGVDVELINAEMNVAQGWVSVSNLTELASKAWVTRIKEPAYPTFNRGSRLTEGDAILRSNIVRESGITGKGIKVAFYLTAPMIGRKLEPLAIYLRTSPPLVTARLQQKTSVNANLPVPVMRVQLWPKSFMTLLQKPN